MSKLVNTQEALRNYNPNNYKSTADIFFDKDDRTITWQINNLCNFNCPYCGKFTNDDPDVYKYSPRHIAECFDKTKKNWHIIITGGEPFLHKNLIEICSLLTKNHYISINTNLSSPKIFEFADKIDPAKVLVINASIHFSVRKERNILDEYIKHFIYLQEKGFKIIGSYVVYPDMLDQYKNDFEYLHSKGLKLISSKLFHGEYNGKTYPEAYSESELNDLTKYMSSEIEMPEYIKYTHFKGMNCSTGRKMLSLLPNGNLERCLSDKTPLGNFFTGKYKLPLFDKKCITEICTCPYQAMLYSYRKKCPLNIF